MRKKFENRKGFTLAELLIVVAIIAVLVAIMVPVFGNSRANAVQAKDASNVRSAYSEAVANALTSNSYDGNGYLAATVTCTVDGNTTVSLTSVGADGNGGTITISTANTSATAETISVDTDVVVTLSITNS